MKEMKKKFKIRYIIIIISVMLSLVTAVSAIISVKNSQETTIKIGATSFVTGVVDSESGKVFDSKYSLVMKNMQSVDGLKVDVDEDTVTVGYRIAFYDENKDLIEVTSELIEDYDSAIQPENAEYFRIIIYPFSVDGERVEIGVFNSLGFINQLEIEIDKN